MAKLIGLRAHVRRPQTGRSHQDQKLLVSRIANVLAGAGTSAARPGERPAAQWPPPTQLWTDHVDWAVHTGSVVTQQAAAPNQVRPAR